MVEESDLMYVRKHLDFWEHLSQSEKGLLERSVTEVSYRTGENVHSTDRECLGVLLVRTGELRAYILSEDGREITLYRMTPGDTCIFSASCVLNRITFDVHIDAEADTSAFLINIAAFGKLKDQNVYVENFAYKNAVERFSDVMWAMEQILFMSFDKRLAIFLLDETAKTGALEIRLTQEQIARYIGSAREVVSRMLKVFQKQGIIEQSRGVIRILDKEKLRDLV